ncbi:hypothetical protein BI364_09450 [Acidihalobacter yilgarnensis]|uniref:AAA+ ATPase domain-containing protein n=2 Tax=Acidihalobacter yilgarnensis TaxID=2819280 RepID=A0A1D8INZ6_9GAMM|nr:hypothetical protein BI364_09450 [Acidihalobacter yilgarnensis]
MLDNSTWHQVAERIYEEDFYRFDHRLIFRVAKRLASQNQPLDVITLSEALERTGDLEQTGGLAYLGVLARDTPSAANIQAYAEIVRDRARLRSLIAAATHIADSAFNPNGRDSTEILDEAQRAVTAVAIRYANTSSAVILLRGDQLEISAIQWLWVGWIARGKLHLLVGAPSTGKTTLLMALAAIVSHAGMWPDGTTAPGGHVVILSFEDDPHDTLVPRLKAAGADMSKIVIVGDVREEDGDRCFDAARDIPILAAALASMPEPPAMLIIDPIVNLVARDSNASSDVRRSLAPLVDLGHRIGCAVIGISHFTKGTTGRDPVERVTGSIAFGALARVVLTTVRRPDDHPEGPARVVVRAKSNIGPDGGGWSYEIEPIELDDHPGLFATRAKLGDAIEGTARTLLTEAETVAEEDMSRSSALDAAADWLKRFLAGGGESAGKCLTEAAKENISERTLHRARRELGIESTVSGFGREKTSVWSLPAGTFNSANSAASLPVQNSAAGMAGLAEMDYGAGYRGGSVGSSAIPANTAKPSNSGINDDGEVAI